MSDLVEHKAIMRAARCGHHFNEECRACEDANTVTNHELDTLRAELAEARAKVERVRADALEEAIRAIIPIVRADALEEAIASVQSEHLEEPQWGTDDVAYEQALNDAVRAIRNLAKG